MTDYARFRLNMVENQLRPNRVSDARVLEAMGEIAREVFVPKPLRGIAYADDDLPLQGDRFLIEPMVLGRLLQAAQVGPGDVLLVLGGGSGYCAAVAARLAATVFLLEPDADEARRIERTMDELGIDNVVVVASDTPAQGHPAEAPYDVILLAGRVPEVPPALQDQLGENGRLVALVEAGRIGQGVLVTRLGASLGRRVLFDASTPALPGFRRREAFVF